MKLLKSMTTSYELSLRLKELGVEQTGEYYWVLTDEGEAYCYHQIPYHHTLLLYLIRSKECGGMVFIEAKAIFISDGETVEVTACAGVGHRKGMDLAMSFGHHLLTLVNTL